MSLSHVYDRSKEASGAKISKIHWAGDTRLVIDRHTHTHRRRAIAYTALAWRHTVIKPDIQVTLHDVRPGINDWSLHWPETVICVTQSTVSKHSRKSMILQRKIIHIIYSWRQPRQMLLTQSWHCQSTVLTCKFFIHTANMNWKAFIWRHSDHFSTKKIHATVSYLLFQI